MKIELKSIKHYPSMSEETECFDADLWIDGKKIGHLSNRGTGGCDDFHGDHAAFAAADAWCRENLPRIEFNHGDDAPMSIDADLETHCGDLLAQHIAGKELDRLIKRQVIGILDGNIVTWKPKVAGTDPMKLLPGVQAKYPSAKLLNTMPRAEAVALYRSA